MQGQAEENESTNKGNENKVERAVNIIWGNLEIEAVALPTSFSWVLLKIQLQEPKKDESSRCEAGKYTKVIIKQGGDEGFEKNFSEAGVYLRITLKMLNN